MMKMTKPVYDTRHQGPWDRGAADNFYGRPFNPHYYKADTSPLLRVSKEEMTTEELEAYKAGWNDNQSSGDKKIWGDEDYA